jgi:hypothetical protein
MTTTFSRLIHLPEPALEFRYDQALEDPRDGLTLFGPLDEAPHYGVRAGVIGPKESIERFKRWAEEIQGPVGLFYDEDTRLKNGFARPPFPGFEAAFRVPWNTDRLATIEIDPKALAQAVRLEDSHQRVYTAVGIYAEPILEFMQKEDVQVDIWFVVVPEEVYRFCRPMSNVPKIERVKIEGKMSVRLARRLSSAPGLFAELNRDAVPYQYEPHFHNQLKGRLLGHGVTTQIVRETTIAYKEFRKPSGQLVRNLAVMESAIAWNLATTTFYKTGGRPWKLARVRDGVCYLGLVFKQDDREGRRDWACCAAKMFLDSGDGIVFRGALGPWHSPETREFHLSERAARELMEVALAAYKEKRGGLPKEVFIHGKVRFDSEEWRGFRQAAGQDVKLVGVRIRKDATLRLYKLDENAALRGLAYVRDNWNAYLWSKGYIPRIRTYAGREVPVPLSVEICKGEEDIEVVLADIMALTKLNYNSCIFADGMPVTLRFAEMVGEILTAGPVKGVPPLPFKYYI